MTERESRERDPWDPDDDDEPAAPTPAAMEDMPAPSHAAAPDGAARDGAAADIAAPDGAAPDSAAADIAALDGAAPDGATSDDAPPDASETAASGGARRADASGSGEAGGREGRRERPLVRKEYYSISEVADLVGLPAHVLRYWESQFSVLNPSKNRSGNRVYQRKEIKLILLVKQLLYDEKYTVEGAKQKLEQLRRGQGVADATTQALDTQTMQVLREELRSLSELLAPDAD